MNDNGIIQFGSFFSGQKKRFTPHKHQIDCNITICDIVCLSGFNSTDSFTLRLLATGLNDAKELVSEQRFYFDRKFKVNLSKTVVNPNLTVEIESHSVFSGILVCWQVTIQTYEL